MPGLSSLILIGAVAWLVSMLVTPLVRRLAVRYSITDRPDGHRKLHDRPIPLGGGVIILAGFWTAMVLAVIVPNLWSPLLLDNWPNLASLLAASLAIAGLGLADDRFGLRGRHKLFGQLIATVILVASGLLISTIEVFGWRIELGLLAVPTTVLWLLLAMNALNLIDGIDGLATTIGLILSTTFCIISILSGHATEALVLAALAGSLVAFLMFNFPPARIYLGDSGSMLIGLLIGTLAIQGSMKGPATVAMAAPLAVWTIPLFDTAIAILRRKLTGRSIYMTDRGHLHHRMLEQSGSPSRALSWIAVACACTCVGALVSVYWKSDAFALLSALAVIATLVATRVFGYVELLLLSSKLKSLSLSMLMLPPRRHGQGRHTTVRLQGSRAWDLLWKSLIESIDKLSLDMIQLDVNVPAFQEGYHASWMSPHRGDTGGLWKTEIPLGTEKHVLGRLIVTGKLDGGSVCEVIDRLMDLLQPFEIQLLELARREDPEVSLDLGKMDQPEEFVGSGASLSTYMEPDVVSPSTFESTARRH